MKFQVLSRKQIEEGNHIVNEPHAIISISSPDSPKPTIPINAKCNDILYLWFWDRIIPKGQEPRIVNQEDAKKIVDFYLKHKGVPYIVCHCDYGISRSAGCAVALSMIENGTVEEFFSKLNPNERVITLIMREYLSREKPC